MKRRLRHLINVDVLAVRLCWIGVGYFAAQVFNSYFLAGSGLP